MDSYMDAALVFTLLVIVALLVYHYYSHLMKFRSICDAQFLVIDAHMSKRRNIIIGMLQAVFTYSQAETDIFDAMRNAHSQAEKASTTPDKMRAQEEVNVALAGLLAAARKHPKVMSDATYLHLQSELHEMDRTIAASRRAFNVAVTRYNKLFTVFPTNILTKIYAFQEHTFFEPDASLGPTTIVKYGKGDEPAPMRLYSESADRNPQ